MICLYFLALENVEPVIIQSKQEKRQKPREQFKKAEKIKKDYRRKNKGKKETK